MGWGKGNNKNNPKPASGGGGGNPKRVVPPSGKNVRKAVTPNKGSSKINRRKGK